MAAPLRTPRRVARAGFTLIEVIVALALAAVVAGGLLLLLLSARGERQRVRENSDLVTRALETDAILQADMAEAGRGLFAAPNWSGLQVRTGGTPGAPADTLVLTRGLGLQLRVSTAPCPSGGALCVLLVGDQRGKLSPGDLVVVGGPTTGARIYGVTVIGETVTQSCGADCATVELNCNDAAVGALSDVVVTGSVLHLKDGTMVTQATPCTYSAFADGSWCEETTGTANVGTATAPTCGAVTSPNSTYTPVTLQDRSAVLGYPALETMTLRSGAEGTPMVALEKVAVTRYFLDTRSGQPVLARGVGVYLDGTPAVIAPVAGGVTTFEVETQHVGQTSFARGVGVTPEMLAMSSDNGNWVQAAGPSTASAVRAWSFTRSYRTLAAARVSYTVSGGAREGETDASGRPTTLGAVVALSHVVNGGVFAPGAP